MNGISRRQAKRLLHMGNVMRSLNGKCDLFAEWIINFIPDSSTEEELMELSFEDYTEACIWFAEHISRLIDRGAWNKDGYSCEFFRNQHVK